MESSNYKLLPTRFYCLYLYDDKINLGPFRNETKVLLSLSFKHGTKIKGKNSLFYCHYNFKHLKNSAAADLGGGCRGCTPPPLEMKPTFFFVFAFKICLPDQSVTPFLSAAPPPKKYPGSDYL